MTVTTEEELSEKMSELYVAECMAAKARLEVETECRRIIADNYEKVIGQAREHSKKLEAPHLSKICEVGYFCDAHLVRTNQLTMEMGANYYTECSIFTAEKIIARRIAEMRKSRDDGLESIRIIDEKMKFAKENFSAVSIDGGPIEIVEKYDEEMEKLFYENRKKRKIVEKTTEKTVTPVESDEEHVKIMERLTQLEMMEEEEEENEKEIEVVPLPPKPFEISTCELENLEEIEEEEGVDDENLRFGMNERLLAQPGVSQKEMERLLEFLDACDKDSSDEEDEDEEEEEEEVEEEEKVEELDSDDYESGEETNEKQDKEEEKKKKKVEEIIGGEKPTSKPKRKSSSVRFAEELEKIKTFHESDTVELTDDSSPNMETKSILRNSEPTPIDHAALDATKEKEKEVAPMSQQTFPGEIVEKHDPYECEPSTSKDPAPVIKEGKVSKFRASRHRN